MTILQIKKELGVESLTMVQQFEDMERTVEVPWVSHWDNAKRLRVTMHQEVFEKLVANPVLDTLAYKTEVVPESGERAAYTRVIVITPRHILGTF